MVTAGIKGYNILLTCDTEMAADNAEKTKENGITATPRL